MANASPVSVGKVNAAGSEDALFLKVFAGEVLTSFERVIPLVSYIFTLLRLI